jgi:hypothetical protein
LLPTDTDSSFRAQRGGEGTKIPNFCCYGRRHRVPQGHCFRQASPPKGRVMRTAVRICAMRSFAAG